jgi:DNA topoisomerase-1
MDLQDLKEIDQGEEEVGSHLYEEGDHCPECSAHKRNGTLTKRFNREEEKEFLGCSNYPNCKFTY